MQSTEREQFWRGLLAQHASSGMTIKDFCRQQGVSTPSFYAWRSKLRERDQPSRINTDGLTPGLVPVQVVSADQQTADHRSDHSIEIVTPDGFTVRLDHPDQLSAVLKTIANATVEASSC